jgi:hypothetical protein
MGVWLATRKFSYGSADNHGSGFSELIYSVGGIYYPDGNKKSFSISAITRFEQTFRQQTTNIDPGDVVVVDWGVASPFIPLIMDHNNIMMVGVSGFATTQYTKETGTYAALNTELYRCFAIGPEAHYAYLWARLKFILRAQWEFGAKNTTQGSTYWIGLAHKLKQKEEAKK